MRNYLFSNGEVKNKQADVFRQPENKIEGKWRLRRSSCLGQITVDQWKRRDRNDANSPLVLRSSRYAYLNTPVSNRPVKNRLMEWRFVNVRDAQECQAVKDQMKREDNSCSAACDVRISRLRSALINSHFYEMDHLRQEFLQENFVFPADLYALTEVVSSAAGPCQDAAAVASGSSQKEVDGLNSGSKGKDSDKPNSPVSVATAGMFGAAAAANNEQDSKAVELTSVTPAKP